MTSRRAGLKLTLLALGILLLGLTPYLRPFTTTMRQAGAYLAAREYGAALAAYRQAAAANPESPLPWLGIGQIYLLQNQSVLATAAFLEAQHRGGSAEAVFGLAESYASQGDWAAATRNLLRAQALAPDDARVYAALGRASVAQGLFDQAKDYLAQALQMDASDEEAAAAHALLGRLVAGDDPQLAANHFEQAGDTDMLAVLDAVNIEHDPARRALLLGIAALQRNELVLARHHLERAMSDAPDDAEAHAYLAHTLDQLGETVTARALLEQALALDEDSTLAYYFMGTHHRLVGNLEAAQAALWQALLRDPENAALRAEMAGTFVDQSDYASAEEWYQGAVAMAPDEVGFHLMLVHFYIDHLYRVAEAGVPAAQALFELSPKDAQAYDLLGWTYHLAGQPSEALQALLQALILDPDLVSAHYHLGSLYATTGQNDAARSHLQRAIDLDTDGYYRSRADLILGNLE